MTAGQKQDVSTSTQDKINNDHSAIPVPPADTAPGLGNLRSTDKVFIVKRKLPIPFPTDCPVMSYYELLNQAGTHIYTLGQANPKEKEKFFLMELYTVGGQLILRIIQRWNEPVQVDDEDLAEILPYLNKDQQLPTIVRYQEGAVLKQSVTAYQLKVDDPDPQIHIRHVNGDFLGHIWKGADCWIIHDTNLTPKYTFPQVTTNQESGKYSENARHKLECWGDKYSYYEYYHSHGLQSISTGEPIGFIETEINIERFGLHSKAKHCSCAHFPMNLSPVDKILVVAMTFSQYCRVTTSAEKAGCTCFWLCMFFSLIFCLATVIGTTVGICLGVLDSTCRTLNIFTGSAEIAA